MDDDGGGERSAIPPRFAGLFWDLKSESLDLDRHRPQVIQRVLQRGDWEAIQWLRSQVGDDGLREWFVRTGGRGLDPRRLRFWQLVLDLPREDVDKWIETMRKDPWHGRSRRDVA